MNKVLIQPSFEKLVDYRKFALENDYHFEIIDFAYPNILDGNFTERIEVLREKLVETNRFYSMHGPVYDLYLNSPDEKIKAIASERIQLSLKIAQKLDIKNVVFHTNYYPMIGFERYYKNWVKSNSEFWLKIIDTFNIRILLENMWDSSPKWLLELLEIVESPNLKVCFDTGHFNAFSRVPLNEWFEALNDHIVYFHLNDNHGKIDEELPTGQGTFDWKFFTQLVIDYCKNPITVIEMANIDYIIQSIDFLKSNSIFPFNF